MAAISSCYDYWEVPYLPIDPHHVGRSYEAVIRVNSQSGKGGVAYIMEAEHGFRLPRRLQIEFSSTIQTVTEDTGTEITPEQMWEVFQERYLSNSGYMSLVSYETSSKDQTDFVTAQVLLDGKANTVMGSGSGPIAAFVEGLNEVLDMDLDVVDYSEHAITSGAGSQAVAYLEVKQGDGMVRWGVGRDKSILAAGLQAVVSAVNRLRDDK
jgi:2-isopropylmalate synthase